MIIKFNKLDKILILIEIPRYKEITVKIIRTLTMESMKISIIIPDLTLNSKHLIKKITALIQ